MSEGASYQADGRNKLERVALELRGQDANGKTTIIAYYKFLINPNNYKEEHPQRSTIFKTRSAIVVEDFGPDLVKISFSGTTGYKKMKDPTDGKTKSGADRLFELRDLLEHYSYSGHRIDDIGIDATEMYFYNFTDGKSYVVHLAPEGFSIERSAERSLLFDYSINLVVLRDARNPDKRDIDHETLGNGYGETTTEAMNPNSKTAQYRAAMTQLRRELP